MKPKKKTTRKRTTRKRKSKALTPYEAMDIIDESQIVNEIEGRIPESAEKMVYSFPDKQTGREVVGLSWRGTKEAWREFNKRKLAQISITDKALISQGQSNGELGNFVDILVYAYDGKRKIGSWGASRGWEKQRKKDGSIIDDKFPSAKAISKAQRNAINNLLPAEKVAKMIKAWIGQGNVRRIESPQALQTRPIKNEIEMLMAGEIEKERIRTIGKALGCKTVGDIEKKTGLRINWVNLTKLQASKILFELMEKKAQK